MSKFAEENVASSLLLVEGPEDVEVVGALCDVHGITPGFAVKITSGLTNLKTAFRTHLKSTNTLKKLWVLLDADSDCRSRWQMLRDILIGHGGYSLKVDEPLPACGAVFEPKDGNGIAVGIWIMPDNEHGGMTESFVESLVDAGDTLIAPANEAVDALNRERDSHPTLFKEVHRPKAVIHTWLAWQDKPGRSMGTAFLRHRLDVSHPLCCSFMDWLRKLQP